MSSPPPDREAMIQAYLKHAALHTPETEYFWAWEAVTDFVHQESPAAVWELVLELLRRADDEQVGLVVAGPLEDMVGQHGRSLVDAIERRAAADEYFRWALGGTWLCHGELPEDVLTRIVRASGDVIHPLPPLDELTDDDAPDT